MDTATRPSIPEHRISQLPTTQQGAALYERAEADYPEPFRSEVMATIHRIEKEAREGSDDD